nr:phospholipase-like, aminotransferase-like mobile domain protein [Tanacetum cinerariifolium]
EDPLDAAIDGEHIDAVGHPDENEGPNEKGGDISFRDRVFPEKIGEYVKSIDLLSVIEDEERFTESSFVIDHWWRKLFEEIPRGRFWSKPFSFQNWEYSGQLFPQWYTLRAPLVEYGGLFGDYLKKLSSAHTLREKDREAWSGTQSSTKEVSLQTQVKDLEGLCNSLMILPKEIKSLKARVNKIEIIINVITLKTKATNVKYKVNTTGTKDKVESVGKQCDLGEKCWIDQDGDFFTYIGSPNRISNKDAVNDLVDVFDDLVDANAKLEEVDKYLSQDDCVKAEKQEAEQRRLKLHLMLEE